MSARPSSIVANTTSALIVHDLKNGLGVLEAELAALAEHAQDSAIGAVHRRCVALRQRFIQYLLLYGSEGALHAHSTDEAPLDLLLLVRRDHAALLAPLMLDVVATAAAPAFWHFDRRLVRLALEAALHNAQRFARARIELSTRADDGHLVLRVDDDGPGLQPAGPDDVQRTGLGTALCEAVARAHDLPGRCGRVQLHDRPGGGARFELWLA